LSAVYSWANLGKPQAPRLVEGTLEEWVRKEQSRGTLTRLTETLTLWEIEDAHVAAVRELLMEAGTFF
jgi:hypothetical protein